MEGVTNGISVQTYFDPTCLGFVTPPLSYTTWDGLSHLRWALFGDAETRAPRFVLSEGHPPRRRGEFSNTSLAICFYAAAILGGKAAALPAMLLGHKGLLRQSWSLCEECGGLWQEASKGRKDEKRPSFQLVLASDTGFFKPFPIVIFINFSNMDCRGMSWWWKVSGGEISPWQVMRRSTRCWHAGRPTGFLFFVDWSIPQNLSMFVGHARPS